MTPRAPCLLLGLFALFACSGGQTGTPTSGPPDAATGTREPADMVPSGEAEYDAQRAALEALAGSYRGTAFWFASEQATEASGEQTQLTLRIVTAGTGAAPSWVRVVVHMHSDDGVVDALLAGSLVDSEGQLSVSLDGSDEAQPGNEVALSGRVVLYADAPASVDLRVDGRPLRAPSLERQP